MDPEVLDAEGASSRGRACGAKRKRVTGDEPDTMRKYHRSIIVKIRMKNFLSYEDHWVFPGPRLNLILGVNGAGKSTINNAICIGLGFDAKLLDRGKDVGDFVRRGASEGIVEIHLSQECGKVVVVKAYLHKEEKNAKFEVNDKPTKKKELLQFVRGLGINLDNLCHFLPQEKVLAFANLAGKPQEMLMEVEKAVGPVQMKKDHEELIDMTQNSSARISDYENQKQHLENLQKKEEHLRQELERFEMHKELEKTIGHCELKQLDVRQKAAKERWRAKKAEMDDAWSQHDDLQAKWEASKAKADEAQKAFDKTKEEKQRCEKLLFSAEKELEELKDGILEAERDANHASRKISELESEKKKLQQDIERKQTEVEDHERERDACVVPADIEMQIRAAVDAVNQASNLKRKLQDDEGRCKRELQESQRDLQNVEGQIRQFEDIKQRKERALRSNNAQLFRAYEFLKSRQNQFDQKVYGPIRLEIDVENTQDAAYVEHCVGNRMLDGFIVQNSRDFTTLHEMMKERNSPVEKITVYRSEPRRAIPNYSETVWAALRKHDIERQLVHSVKAEDPVLSVLCSSGMLDHAFVGAPRAFDNYDRVLGDEALHYVASSNKRQHVLSKGCFTPKGRFHASFSFHGRQTMLSYTDDFRRAQRLVVGDNNQINELNARRGDLQVQCEQREAELNQIVDKISQMSPDLNQKQLRLKQLKDQKNKKNILDHKIQQLQKLIADKKKQDPMKARPKYERDIEQCHGKMMHTVQQIAIKAIEASKAKRKFQELELRHQPLKEKWTVLKRKALEDGDEFAKAKQKVNELDKELKVLKREFEVARQRRQEALPDLTQEHRDAFEQLPDTEEELEQRIDDIKDEIERLGIPMDRKQEYEDVKAEIRDTEQKIDSQKDYIENLQTKINTLKTRWLEGDEEGLLYPAPVGGLKNVISIINREFSETFEEMGNVGEVKLKEAKFENGEDDFANYAIEIMVKFRKTQELQRLDGQVQSGGETSLSTMLFLVSLQQITEAPFRVVDEINQGMDQQYEKAVFDRIVKWSCRDNTSQTFLITPKLAPTLLDSVEYENDDDMRIIVASKGVETVGGGVW